MLRLTRILDAAPDAPALTTLTLAFDARNKSRQRVVLDNGDAAALMLARGSVLHAGDWLANADGTYFVRVCAADETLSTVACADRTLLNRACYHLGNRHVPLQIFADRLYYRHDYVLDDMIVGLGLSVTVEQAPFQPEPGAYGQADRHSHAHHHGHAHAG